MADIIGYVETQHDTFDTRPLCEVDSLVLSWFSYFCFPAEAEGIRTWSGVPLRTLLRAEWFEAAFGRFWGFDNSRRLIYAMAASPRFRDIKVCGHVDELDSDKEKQFSAMALRLSPYDTYVAFRGTDNTIVGWKEDFNMAFDASVPSQQSAVSYLEAAAGCYGGTIYTGGHSKGGNLAIYSARMCDPKVRSRVARAYSHDGPGFNDEVVSNPRWRDSDIDVHKTMPQSSLIGMLFEKNDRYAIVKSTASGGILQHDPFSWVVEGTGFALVEDLTRSAQYVDGVLDEWIRGLTAPEREEFVDALFDVFTASGTETFAELRDNWKRAIPAMASAAVDLSPTTRDLLVRTVIDLLARLLPHSPAPLVLAKRLPKGMFGKLSGLPKLDSGKKGE